MTGPRSCSSARVVPVLAGTAALTLLAASPGPAHASDAGLLLSSDGTTYVHTLPDTVFGNITGYVPGASSSADLWVRNDSNDSAFLSIAVLTERPAIELAADLGLRIHSSLRSTARVPLGGSGSCTDLAAGWVLAPGESTRLTLVLDLKSSASNAARRQSTGFALRFLLEDQDGGSGLGACTHGGGTVIPGLAGKGASPSQPGAPLAVTGSPDLLGWILSAGAALAAGTGILTYIRRNKAGSDEQR